MYQLLSQTSSIYSPASIIYDVAASDQVNLAKMSPETLAKIYADIYKMRALNLAFYESETDPAKKAQITADFYPLMHAELLLTNLLLSNDSTKHIATQPGTQQLAQDIVAILATTKIIKAVIQQVLKKETSNSTQNDSTELEWTFGGGKSEQKWANRMESRGWTEDQITEAIKLGKQYKAPNNVTPGNTATRYVHPQTGRSVVIDDITKEVIHIGGDGFKY